MTSTTHFQPCKVVYNFINDSPGLRTQSFVFCHWDHLGNERPAFTFTCTFYSLPIHIWFHMISGFSPYLGTKFHTSHTAKSTLEFLMNWLLNVNVLWGCKYIVLEANPLFLSFCGRPNYPVFVKTFSLLVLLILILLILVKKFIPQKLFHRCKYCSENNMNKLGLLVSRGLGVKKEQQSNRLPHISINSKENCTALNYRCSVLISSSQTITSHGPKY